MSTVALRQFGVFFDKYYWKTAVMIAQNGLGRMYRNSFFGMLWTVFQPLTMVVVYSTIMPLIMRAPTSDYTLFIIVSIPVWNFFSACIIGSGSSILSNGETLKRCIVSSSVFPIADVLRNTYTFFVSFMTMYVASILFGFGKFSLTMFLIPVYFIPVLVTICSMAVALAFISPYIRDVGEIAAISMTVLFWFTPVVYPVTMLSPKTQFLMQFNPFYVMIHPIQELGHEHILPSFTETWHLLALAALSVAVGFSVFRICRRNYVYYL